MGLVYLIKNKINGKCYVGKTIKSSFYERYGRKWWKRHHNPILLKSIEKHGYENFEVMVLIDNIATDAELLELEKIYGLTFNVYFPEGYNLQECGQPSFVTEETIKKRAKSIKEKYNDPVYREKHRLSMLGVKKTLRQPRKPFSEETKRKISEGNKGKKGNTNPRPDLIEYNKTREWTDEMRGKISKLNKC